MNRIAAICVATLVIMATVFVLEFASGAGRYKFPTVENRYNHVLEEITETKMQCDRDIDRMILYPKMVTEVKTYSGTNG